MSCEILVNIGAQETRVALVEGGAAQEIRVQRATRHSVAGNLYKGVIKRVLPGMQAAFVDIGLERTAFLHIADMFTVDRAPNGVLPAIESVLREGQEVLAQVLKDPIGTKGARLTTLLSLPSRFLVLMPFEHHVGVSTKIEDEAERTRLRGILDQATREHAQAFLDKGGGVIVRTAGEGATAEMLIADLQFLLRVWQSIEAQLGFARAGSLVHGDLPLSIRVLRDLLNPSVERIRIDNVDEARRARQFAQVFAPQASERIEHYQGPAPIFDLYGVEDELNRALDRRVALKSGGHLVIDQTEAMTTIDVNTGAFVGHHNVDETILRTNLEAASTIARQLRLRNLGGIIIIDFIDMPDDELRAQVLRTLSRDLARDSARTRVFGFTPLGLVQMTRKRTHESLGHILCEPCPTCEGRGHIKTVETICFEILRELQRAARLYESRGFLVIASPKVIARLTDEQSGALGDFEATLKRPIRLQAETYHSQESFDVVPV